MALKLIDENGKAWFIENKDKNNEIDTRRWSHRDMLTVKKSTGITPDDAASQRAAQTGINNGKLTSDSLSLLDRLIADFDKYKSQSREDLERGNAQQKNAQADAFSQQKEAFQLNRGANGQDAIGEMWKEYRDQAKSDHAASRDHQYALQLNNQASQANIDLANIQRMGNEFAAKTQSDAAKYGADSALRGIQAQSDASRFSADVQAQAQRAIAEAQKSASIVSSIFSGGSNRRGYNF